MNIKIAQSSREKQNLHRLCLICFPSLPLGFKLPPFGGTFQPTVAGWLVDWMALKMGRAGSWPGGGARRMAGGKSEGCE